MLDLPPSPPPSTCTKIHINCQFCHFFILFFYNKKFIKLNKIKEKFFPKNLMTKINPRVQLVHV